MRMRLLFSEEDEVRKKKTLIVVVAFLLIPVLLGLYAVTGPEGDLIAGVTPTSPPSPSAVATATPLVPTFTATAEATVTPPIPAATATAMPTASATLVAEATATPVPPEPTVISTTATPVVLKPAFTPTATPLSTPTPVPPEPTVISTTATPVVLEPTFTPTATPLSTPTPVRPEPTIPPTATSVALKPTPTPTVVPIVPLTAPVITTPPDGSVLKDDQPTIAGAAPPNTTVQVYDDGSLVGTTVADAQGDWALVADEPLEPGEHTVTAVASDDTGRTSNPSVAVTLTVVIERLPVTGSSWFERWLERLLPIASP